MFYWTGLRFESQQPHQATNRQSHRGFPTKGEDADGTGGVQEREDRLSSCSCPPRDLSGRCPCNSTTHHISLATRNVLYTYFFEDTECILYILKSKSQEESSLRT